MLLGRFVPQFSSLGRNLCSGKSSVFGSLSRRICSKAGKGEEDEKAEEDEFPYSDIPRPGKTWERKPYPTPMRTLIRRAKENKRIRQENPCRLLVDCPENGLLVPELIEVAHRVYHARQMLLHGLSKLLDGDAACLVKKCRFCSEVHIGRTGHEIRTCEGPGCGSRNSTHVWMTGRLRDVVGFPYCYHLVDRVGKPRVGHKERFGVRKLPAIVELCIQAGVDLDRYPTKRRTRPVYSIEGRIVDFEPELEDNNVDQGKPKTSAAYSSTMSFEEELATGELSSQTLRSWLDMRSGAMDLMKKYSVLTCGYCPEVQVGPKGHKVRLCKATKHQQRDGMHAWQEATIDDLIRPNYVWHVNKADNTPLANELKRYYGKAPAIVELCVQAGASVPAEFKSMMRLDIVLPARDEHDLVA